MLMMKYNVYENFYRRLEVNEGEMDIFNRLESGAGGRVIWNQ